MKQKTLWMLLALTGITSACGNGSKSNGQATVSDKEIVEIWEDAPVVASIQEVNGYPVTVVDWEKINTTLRLPLSHFIEDLEIVKLDNRDEALVKRCLPIVSDHYILVTLAKDIPFRLFDRKGKFLCNIGKMGGGPGEYTGPISHAQLDEKHNRIYIAQLNTRKILAYDLNGKYVEDIPITESPQDDVLLKVSFYVDNEKQQVTVATLPFRKTPSMIWTQDFQGKRLKEVSAKPYEVTWNAGNQPMSRFNGPYFDLSFEKLYDAEEDTLFHYHADKGILQPVFTIDYPGNAAEHSFVEHPNYFIGQSAAGDPIKEGINRLINMDKKFIVDKKTLRGGLYEIYNDFLGDIPVSTSWFYKSHYGYYAINMFTSYFMEELQKGLKNPDLSPEMRTKMQTLLDSMDEDDNNYILLGKLKQ